MNSFWLSWCYLWLININLQSQNLIYQFFNLNILLCPFIAYPYYFSISICLILIYGSFKLFFNLNMHYTHLLLILVIFQSQYLYTYLWLIYYFSISSYFMLIYSSLILFFNLYINTLYPFMAHPCYFLISIYFRPIIAHLYM